MAQVIAPLRQIPRSQISQLDAPVLQIRTDEDVVAWKESQSYLDYAIFLRRLNESVVGYPLPYDGAQPPSPAITRTLALLEALDGWIDEIPPQESPQRFGNLAFRTWGRRLEKQATSILTELLPEDLAPVIPLITPYLLTSFGSFLRMDYGTGHETSFALFLMCLTLVRFYDPTPDEERYLVLHVFTRYLRLCWRLQDIYKLEPAGSHGVWGLDDSHFLGYIFGSGQLRDQNEIPVSGILKSPLPPTNLYFMSIMRIHEVKHGPFHEHSSQLHSIAVGVPYWGKVNSGLFKMYEAEVLGKRVVVQHIPLGGFLPFHPNGRGDATNTITARPDPMTSTSIPTSGTTAPWASAPNHAAISSATSRTQLSPSTAHTESVVTTSFPLSLSGLGAPSILPNRGKNATRYRYHQSPQHPPPHDNQRPV